MFLEDIFRENGLEILHQRKMKYFRLRFTVEEIARKRESEIKGHVFDYDLEGSFNVELTEMGFNSDGGLWLVFTCTDDEHFEVGDTFEVIEYSRDGDGCDWFSIKIFNPGS